MNYFTNPILEPYERLSGFIQDGLPQEVREAIAPLRKARSEAGSQFNGSPPESIINTTLDPTGWEVNSFLGRTYTADQVAQFASVFTVRHLIADEIERLMAILDALSGDDDLELNVSNYWGNDPRLEDAEGVTVSSDRGSYGADEDAEPSLGSHPGDYQVTWGADDRCIFTVDAELDTSDDEPSLCGVIVERGDDRDLEANLGSFDRMVDQTKALRIRSGERWPIHDGEADRSPAN